MLIVPPGLIISMISVLQANIRWCAHKANIPWCAHKANIRWCAHNNRFFLLLQHACAYSTTWTYVPSSVCSYISSPYVSSHVSSPYVSSYVSSLTSLRLFQHPFNQKCSQKSQRVCATITFQTHYWSEIIDHAQDFGLEYNFVWWEIDRVRGNTTTVDVVRCDWWLFWQFFWWEYRPCSRFFFPRL